MADRQAAEAREHLSAAYVAAEHVRMHNGNHEAWREFTAALQKASAEVDALSVRLAQAEQERDQALRSAALREMETARASEYRAQLNDVTGRLVAQRRRLRELEGLQAGESSWQRERAEKAEVRLREYEEALTRAADAIHEAEARLVLCHASGPEPGNLSRIDSALADVREARAALAASGGREAPDTKEPT